MTSDAKIGLLLGLVFIFVIAFIINGLPNFGTRAQDANAAPVARFDGDDLGLADRAQDAQERLDLETLLETSGPEASHTVALEPAPLEMQELVIPESQGPLSDDTSEYRSVYALDNLLNGASQKIKDIARGVAEASEAVMMQRETLEPVPALDPARPQPTETVRRQTPAQTNSPARPRLARTYVVQEGDVLATVAKKVYGPVEGNRLVNVRRIYQANALLLNSPDEIFVGQTLVIPPLPETRPGTEAPNPTLSEAVFEKVQAVGRRELGGMTPAQPEGRWYTVEEGDSLWKIASNQLGSGARCDEIARMNTDILKNKDTLDIGMRLRLPLK